MLDGKLNNKIPAGGGLGFFGYPRKHQQHAMGSSLEMFVLPRRMPSGPRYGPLK